MRSRLKLLLIFIVTIIITACSSQNPEELSELIETPKLDSPVIEGTWQVTRVDNISGKSNLPAPKIGDRLYINQDLVAINNEYAYPPSFTSKYVNLNEYIKNRGFEISNVDDRETVVVVNASQGQFFSRDFIKRSNDEMFYIADDNLIYLSKLAANVEKDLVEKYAALANTERIQPAINDQIHEDIALLLGVRERYDLINGELEYKYATYLIRITEDEEVHWMKAPDIFVRRQDEFWKVRSPQNAVSGNYVSIEAFPARLDSQMDEQKNISRYSFRDFDMNIRLTFVDKDYISFAYTSNIFNNTIAKYGLVETNDLEDNRLLNINEYTGENDASEQFEEMVKNELTNKVPDVDPAEIIPDTENFGLVRDAGAWTIQTSIYTDDMQVRTSSQLPIRNHIEDTSTTNASVTRDQVRNINSQFKDYHILNNGNYIVIQTADEILIHRISNDLIEKNPFYSIATPQPSAFISIDQQSGSNAESLENAFLNNNKIIDSN